MADKWDWSEGGRRLRSGERREQRARRRAAGQAGPYYHYDV